MITYHKIDAIFERDTQGTKRLIPFKFRNPAVEYLADNQWIFTEKIDGTNIRVCWDGHTTHFAGRTDKANIPNHLLEFLNNTFNTNETEELFEQIFGEKEVILFGEGYGSKIQKGHLYRDDVSFILFDVLIDNIWLKRESVEDIAKTFGIDVVPVIGQGTLTEAIEIIKSQPKSTIGNANMEGIVARPLVEIYDRLGNRVITKIKCCDFKE